MKLFVVGLWAVAVTLGAGWVAGSYALGKGATQETPVLAGLQYTSLPTMSVPVIDAGEVEGYVVVRMVYTADSAVLKNLAAKPDAFITDEIFRSIYATTETDFGKLKRMDLEKLAGEAKDRVNARMGDKVVEDLLVDGLNYIDLHAPDGGRAAAAAVAAQAQSAPGRSGGGAAKTGAAAH